MDCIMVISIFCNFVSILAKIFLIMRNWSFDSRICLCEIIIRLEQNERNCNKLKIIIEVFRRFKWTIQVEVKNRKSWKGIMFADIILQEQNFEQDSRIEGQ